MSAIVTLTLNPALDVSSAIDALSPAIKLRCEPELVDPGGGGLNAARTIAALGGDATAVHCSGGDVGRRLQRLLDREGVTQRIVPIAGETRESFAILERRSGRQYRFVLPGPHLTSSEWRSALATTVQEVQEGSWVLASGSLPRGVPADCYARLARAVSAVGARLVLDTAGAALEAALRAGVYMVKPNWREFDALAGAARELSEHERRGLASQLVRDGATEVVVVTLGARGTRVTTAGGHLEIRPPRVEVDSPVGGGDSFAGAMLHALASGRPLEAASRFAVAAAAAAVQTPGTAPPRRADVERLHRAIGDEHVTRLRLDGGTAPLPVA